MVQLLQPEFMNFISTLLSLYYTIMDHLPIGRKVRTAAISRWILTMDGDAMVGRFISYGEMLQPRYEDFKPTLDELELNAWKLIIYDQRRVRSG